MRLLSHFSSLFHFQQTFALLLALVARAKGSVLIFVNYPCAQTLHYVLQRLQFKVTRRVQ